uniref:ARAD1C07436p n=1 Tax=Blastobotrys adeninivorans TaxID=409370 RepID=A0A060T501_BLAAD
MSAPVQRPDAPSEPLSTTNADEFIEGLKKIPFFMTQLEDEPDSEGATQIEALKALAYEGEPHEIALNFKNHGNDCYRAKKYKDAVEYYTKALAVKCGVAEIDAACYNNRAACNLELKNYRRCINDCKQALMLDGSNVKALYRSAKAYKAIDSLDEARDCLVYGLTIDSENGPLKSLLKEVELRAADLKKLEEMRRAKEEHKLAKQRALNLAVESRGWSFMATDSPRDHSEMLEIKLDEETNHLSTLLIPVIILYPLERESDIIQSQPEDVDLLETVSLALQEAPPWFSKSPNHPADYALSNLSFYLQTSAGGLAKVGRKATLAKALDMKEPRLPLIDSALRIYVVPKNRANEFLGSWDKAYTLSQMRETKFQA